MVRASVVTDGMDAVASQYEAIRSDYARRLQVPATYTVFPQDSIYYADHCLGTGNDFSGSDATTVIESALNALTSGRTWKEVVALKGNFPLTTTLNITSDYTILDLTQAYLRLTADVDMIQIGTTTNLAEQIEVLGGVLYGAITGAGTKDLVKLYGRYVRFKETTFTYSENNAVLMEGDTTTPEYNWMNSFDHCIFSNNADACVYINNRVAYTDFNHCYFDGVNGATSSGIYCTDPNGFSGGHYIRDSLFYQMGVYGAYLRGSDNWVHDTYFWKIGYNGIVIASDAAWQHYGTQIHDNNLADCSYGNSTTYSAILFVDDGGGKATRCNVHDNIIQQLGADLLDYGIDANNATYSHFHDNYVEVGCYNAATALTTGTGLYNRVYANTDLNPVGLLETLGWAGGSPYTCTNSYHVPATLYLYGGNIAGVTKNATEVIGDIAAAEAVQIHLEPGETCIITYTVQPTGLLFGH